jgi:hypothetical protein
MPNRRLQVHDTPPIGLLLLAAIAMQGCVAMVWLGTVGIDRARTSDIEFQSFENLWVIAPHERPLLGSMKSLAVMPFVGDPVMAERWAAVFRETTDLRVVSQTNATWYGVSDYGQIGLAKRISTELQVDCVLFGNVAVQEPKKSFAGFKESSSQRLSLHLMSASGTLMWKTELPFTMVKGTKGMDEEFVTQALLAHVRAQTNELGLTELGTRTVQTLSRPSHGTPEAQWIVPQPGFERP